MSEQVRAVASGPVLWIMAIVIVGVVIAQAYLFRKRAIKYSKENHVLTDEEIKLVTKNGAFSALGPAMSVFIMALTISGMLGGPFVLMRVGIIGSADTELRTATMAAMVSGTTLGVDEVSMSLLGTIFFTCAFMSVGYLIWVPIMTRGLGKGLSKFLMPDPNVEQTKPQKVVGTILQIVPVLFILMMVVMYASSGIPFLMVMATSAVIKVVCDKLSSKVAWLKQWALGFAVLGSMLSSILWNAIF